MANNITIINGIVRHGTDYYYASDIKSVHIVPVRGFTKLPENICSPTDISEYMFEHYRTTDYSADSYSSSVIYVHYSTGEYYINIQFKDGTSIAGETTTYKSIDDAEDVVIEIMSASTKPFVDKV